MAAIAPLGRKLLRRHDVTAISSAMPTAHGMDGAPNETVGTISAHAVCALRNTQAAFGVDIPLDYAPIRL